MPNPIGTVPPRAPLLGRLLPRDRATGLALPSVVFLNLFAWAFVQVSLPFYLRALSPDDPSAALRWTGWVLGITPMAIIAATPLWIKLGSNAPRAWCIRVLVLQGLCFLPLVLTRNGFEVFLSRFLVGLSGPPVTFAFMIVGRTAGAALDKQMSAMTSALAAGLTFGPIAGAYVATRLGYHTSFIAAGVIIGASAALVWWGLAEAPPSAPRPEHTAGRRWWWDLLSICIIVLIAHSQLMFLVAILPNVLPPLGVPEGIALDTAGAIVFMSGLAQTIGALAAPILSKRLGDSRAITMSVAASSVVLYLLGLVSNVWLFVAVRLIQALIVAPALPLLVAKVTRLSSPQALGLVNNSRVSASFVGPVMATSILSVSSSELVFTVLAVCGLACCLLPLPHPILRRPATLTRQE